MSGNHHHKHEVNSALKVAFALNFLYLFIEIGGGIMTNSLALLSDAGHMVTDVSALGIAMLAAHLAEKPKSEKNTYGYIRAEIIGAFFNGFLLFGICFYILYEAIQRFMNPVTVQPGGLISVATIGLMVNLVSAWLLFRHQKNNLNIKGAFIHLMSDALGSVGAIVSGFLIYFYNWHFADPLVSIFIAILIFYSAYAITRQSMNVLLESVPPEIKTKKVEKALLKMKEIASVHDLHIWQLGSDSTMLSCHLCLKEEKEPVSSLGGILEKAEKMLKDKWNIHHCTIQIEPATYQEKHRLDCQK